MANSNNKAIKRLVKGGLSVVCIVLVVVFTLNFHGKDKTADTPTIPDNGQADVAVISITGTSEPNVSAPAVSGNTTNDADDPVLDVDNGDQVDVNISDFDKPAETPAPPTVSDKNALTDPKTTPTYDDSQTKIESGNDTPHNGDKKDGYIYVDGFGWVKDEGGGSVGTTVGEEGDQLTGNKVGSMD